MHILLVVGVFRSKSEADNAHHRLVSEGIVNVDIIERIIDVQPMQSDSLSEDLRRRYRLMPPGEETFVAVKVPDVDQAEAVQSIMMMFEPKQMDLHELIAGRLVVAEG